MNLATIENAVRAWVKSGSGLDDQHVIISDQDGPAPGPDDYISIKFTTSQTLGSMHDMDQNFTDLTQPNGSEIILQRGGTAEQTVSVQAFVMPQASHSASRDARQYLLNVKDALNLPSVRAALQAVGLSPL